MTRDFLCCPPLVRRNVAAFPTPLQWGLIARAQHDLRGARRIAHADRDDTLFRDARGLVNIPHGDPEIVFDCGSATDPYEHRLVVSNRPISGPEAATGWGVFWRWESFGLEHWSKSSFRPVYPFRYGTTILSARFSESTHPKLLELDPDKICIRAPAIVPIDRPDACGSSIWKSSRSFWVGVGRSSPVLIAYYALIGDGDGPFEWHYCLLRDREVIDLLCACTNERRHHQRGCRVGPSAIAMSSVDG